MGELEINQSAVAVISNTGDQREGQNKSEDIACDLKAMGGKAILILSSGLLDSTANNVLISSFKRPKLFQGLYLSFKDQPNHKLTGGQ